jgi:hypothetical protein
METRGLMRSLPSGKPSGYRAPMWLWLERIATVALILGVSAAAAFLHWGGP